MNDSLDYLRTILVVDDEEINRELLGEILKEQYDVIYANDGIEALSQIKSYKNKISLVMLDLIMPDMDGYEVLENLKKDSELSKIPVIVLTSEQSAEVKSLKLGAVDFLTKPYNHPEVILARAGRSIELAESAKLILSTEFDSLTGLYNREYFFEFAKNLSSRSTEKLMDAVAIKLSNFHFINELYGRDFGSNVLKIIANDIKSIAEEDSGIACRFDSDVFYLYTAQHWNYDKPLERIKFHLSEVLKETEIQVHMGVCQGMYIASSIEQRFERALHACESLRSTYGVGFAKYNEEMHDEELKRAKILSDFPSAIEEKEFKVYYQPKFNIKGEQPKKCSFEALVKWHHKEFGVLEPDSFIPQFEENGLIQNLDRYVWTEVARQIKEWKENNKNTLPVSVNVSRIDMNNSETVDFLSNLIKEYSLSTSDILLEITESAYIENSEMLILSVKKLQELGFKIEMDDFGTGYSSLNMLSTLPVDAIKLDIDFIKNIETDKIARYMVKVVLEIAKNFKIPVIAEGVETKEQFAILKQMNCDIIQGFYLAKPMSADKI